MSGPSNAGPGERQEMLERGRSFLIGAGVAADQIVRLDVPGRGGGEDGEGPLRTDLEPLIPMLQSGSLFGDKQGVMVVEAQNLNAAETALLAELLAGADDESVAVSLVAFGSLAASLAKLIKAIGEVVTVRKMWERQAGEWLGNEVRHRDLVARGRRQRGTTAAIRYRHCRPRTGPRPTARAPRQDNQGTGARSVSQPSRRSSGALHRRHLGGQCR